jgi:L-rhamnose-H+ transport protein
MDITWAFLLIAFAGASNGSFALPIKYLGDWNVENVFLIYGLFSFVVLPWALALYMMPQILAVYASMSIKMLGVIIVGGFVFGLGQICFALALKFIGVGLAFLINIGLAIILGSVLPLIFLHPEQIYTKCGFLVVCGSSMAAAGLIFSHRAGHLFRGQRRTYRKARLFRIGVMLAVAAGISSAGQNVSFALTREIQWTAATPFTSAIIMWPGFLSSAFIPYAFYMVHLNVRNDTFHNYIIDAKRTYYLLALAMAALWYGSLLLYSKAAQLMGGLGPVIGWPLFMILILLTSSFWGWYHREWEGWNKKVKLTFGIGLGLLAFGVILLGVSSRFA